MQCDKCGNTAVLVPYLFGGDSWFCRTCKNEPKPQAAPAPKTPPKAPISQQMQWNSYFSVNMTAEEFDFWIATQDFRDSCIKNRGVRVQQRPKPGDWEVFLDGKLK